MGLPNPATFNVGTVQRLARKGFTPMRTSDVVLDAKPGSSVSSGSALSAKRSRHAGIQKVVSPSDTGVSGDTRRHACQGRASGHARHRHPRAAHPLLALSSLLSLAEPAIHPLLPPGTWPDRTRCWPGRQSALLRDPYLHACYRMSCSKTAPRLSVACSPRRSDHRVATHAVRVPSHEKTVRLASLSTPLCLFWSSASCTASSVAQAPCPLWLNQARNWLSDLLSLPNLSLSTRYSCSTRNERHRSETPSVRPSHREQQQHTQRASTRAPSSSDTPWRASWTSRTSVRDAASTSPHGAHTVSRAGRPAHRGPGYRSEGL